MSRAARELHDRHRDPQHAAGSRVSDWTAFFTMGDDRAGYLVEMGSTGEIFTNPRNR